MKDIMSPADFIKQYPVVSFSKGEMILSPNEQANTLYAIRTGFVKVYSIDAKGNERLLWIAGRLDIVPTELFFSPRSHLQFFYAAIGSTTMYKINKAEFLAYAATNQPAMNEIARSMSMHYDDLLSRIQAVEQSSIREKLLQTLWYLGTRFSAEDTVKMHELGLMLTHQDLANLIGATRETTAIELKRMKDDGLINYSRSTLTLDIPKLQALVD